MIEPTRGETSPDELASAGVIRAVDVYELGISIIKVNDVTKATAAKA
jgi:hypothetical protein